MHRRVAALPASLGRAAIAWLQTEKALAAELEHAASDSHGASGSPLRAVPYFLKDLFNVAGVPTRAGSPFFAEVRPTPGDSTLVRRLRELGAALAGKSHLVEFAAGLTGENRTFGDCPHPHFSDRLSGGSSSGSAALVGASVVPFAIGTDTGGSVRVPAAFCGVYGYRLTPGDSFISDAVPLSPSLDTAGWFTGNAQDMRAANRALIGESAPLTREPRGVFFKASDLFAGADPELDAACAAAAGKFSAPPDDVTRAELSTSWKSSVDTYTTLAMREAHAVHSAWLEMRRPDYDPVIWQRFTDAGAWPIERIEAAQADRAQLQRTFARFFQTYDFLVLPAAPCRALTKAQCTLETRRSILACTTPGSLANTPCLTVPLPLADGLTAGLQILAARPDSPVFDWVLKRVG